MGRSCFSAWSCHSLLCQTPLCFRSQGNRDNLVMSRPGVFFSTVLPTPIPSCWRRQRRDVCVCVFLSLSLSFSLCVSFVALGGHASTLRSFLLLMLHSTTRSPCWGRVQNHHLLERLGRQGGLPYKLVCMQFGEAGCFEYRTCLQGESSVISRP